MQLKELRMQESTVPSRARGGVTIRISVAERRLLEAASATRPEHLTTYIREAALQIARRDLTLVDVGQASRD